MRGGFCVTGDGPMVQFHLLGESSLGRLISFRRTTEGAALLVGRLHYREDVTMALDGRTSREELTDDAGLALAAYRRWGRPKGLGEVGGCFAAAVWDAKEQHLYARRDLMGGFPLYWGQCGRRVAIGTHLQFVCSQISATEMDPEYEAEYLMLPACGEQEVAREWTPYRNVQRLLPRTLLDLDLVAGRVRVTEHWKWLDSLEEPTSSEPDAIATRYLELLRSRGARSRVAGRTAAHVSGGMDSTSVALLAASEIEQGAGAGPLHTISLVYNSMSVLSRERQVIESAVRGHPQMVPHFIFGDSLLDFAPYTAPPDHDEPWPWLGMAGTEMARGGGGRESGGRHGAHRPRRGRPPRPGATSSHRLAPIGTPGPRLARSQSVGPGGELRRLADPLPVRYPRPAAGAGP